MSTIRVIGREDIQKVFTVTAALRAVESAYVGKSAGTGRVWPMVFHEFAQSPVLQPQIPDYPATFQYPSDNTFPVRLPRK